MLNKHVKLIILFVLLLGLDLLTKYFFYNLHWGESSFIINPVLNLGVSRSMAVPAIISIIIGCIAFLLFLLFYNQKYISWIIAALLLAGTLGNLLDRIIFGGVRDFIFVGSWFPIFNIADILLNGGIILYFLKEIFPGKRFSKL